MHILRFKSCCSSGALKDFDKVAVSNIDKDSTTNTLDSQKQSDKCETSSETFAENWSEDFLIQTADQFERNLQNLQNLLQNGKLNKIYKKYTYLTTRMNC